MLNVRNACVHEYWVGADNSRILPACTDVYFYNITTFILILADHVFILAAFRCHLLYRDHVLNLIDSILV